MAKQTSSQSIDALIQRIKHIIENRCSLSDKDRASLQEATVHLEEYQRTRKINGVAQLLLVLKAIDLITKLFH